MNKNINIINPEFEKVYYVELKNKELYSYRILKKLDNKENEKSSYILLIHGSSLSSIYFDELAENLSKFFTIIAINLRGYSFSSYNSEINTIKDFSQDLQYFLEALNIPKLDSLIGLSLGGGIAMQFAIDFQEKVEKLILIGTLSMKGHILHKYDQDGNQVRIKSKEDIYSNERLLMIPCLLIHGKEDKCSDYQESVKIYNILKKNNPKTKLFLIEKGCHLPLCGDELEIVSKEIIDFLT